MKSISLVFYSPNFEQLVVVTFLDNGAFIEGSSKFDKLIKKTSFQELDEWVLIGYLE